MTGHSIGRHSTTLTLAFFFQCGSNGQERKPGEFSKILQSISPNDDTQQKLSQNSLETTSEITPLKSGLLYLPMYYQARLKLSLSPEHSLLLSLFHFCVCQDCILPMKHSLRQDQVGLLDPQKPHRQKNHWPLVRKLADLEEKEREQEAMVKPTYYPHG